MALFNFGKKKGGGALPKKATEAVAPVVAAPKIPKAAKDATGSGSGQYAHVFLRPRVTEKATDVTSNSVYVFEIDPRVGKREVREAMKRDYKVNPEKIRIVNLPAKKVSSPMRGGFSGATKRVKKAYVYLPKGTTIEVV